jgi:hypothetical protein
MLGTSKNHLRSSLDYVVDDLRNAVHKDSLLLKDIRIQLVLRNYVNIHDRLECCIISNERSGFREVVSIRICRLEMLGFWIKCNGFI